MIVVSDIVWSNLLMIFELKEFVGCSMKYSWGMKERVKSKKFPLFSYTGTMHHFSYFMNREKKCKLF